MLDKDMTEIIGGEWSHLVMAVEFSLSELQLRRRQNTLAAKSISTDGTEGNLLRNFQVLTTRKKIEDEKLWKIICKNFPRSTNFRMRPARGQWRCFQQYQRRQARPWGQLNRSPANWELTSNVSVISWDVCLTRTRTILSMQEITLPRMKKMK